MSENLFVSIVFVYQNKKEKKTHFITSKINMFMDPTQVFFLTSGSTFSATCVIWPWPTMASLHQQL